MPLTPQEALGQFLDILRDNELFAALQENPDDALDNECKDKLTTLAHKFLPHADDMPRKKAKTAGGNKGGRKPKVEEPKKAKSPWASFLRLQGIALSAGVQQHLRVSGSDARAFFYGKEVTNRALDLNGNASGEAFILQYQYTKTIDGQMGLDRARWLFLMLMWHDIVKLARPECSGNRIGHLMQQDLLNLVTPVYQSSTVMKEYSIEAVADELHMWCAIGAKLSVLVEPFGEGCVFFLQDQLSRNFLFDKMTASGVYYNEAMEHLRGPMNIDQALRDNPMAATLGQNVRALLLKPFKEAKERAVTTEV